MSTNAQEKRRDATVLTLGSKFTFGRYKKTDKTVADVVAEDPEYLIWANTSVDFIIVPVEILAMCYDGKLPSFRFKLEELQKTIQFFEVSFEGVSLPPQVEYTLQLLRHLREEFSLHHEIKIKLDE